MNNQQLYQKIDRFTLQEAAALWGEFPLDSKNPELELIEKLINTTHVRLRLEYFKNLVRKEEEAYDLVLTEIAIDHLENGDRTLYAVASGNTTFYSIKDGIHKGIPKANSNDRVGVKLSNKEYRFKSILRSELIEVANALGEKPKFLFPSEDRKQGLDNGWGVKGNVSRASYFILIEVLCLCLNIDNDFVRILLADSSKASCQEAIKVLCNKLKIDIKNKDAVGKICLKAEEAGLKLTDRTILKILNEIEPLRPKNSNRSGEKRKS